MTIQTQKTEEYDSIIEVPHLEFLSGDERLFPFFRTTPFFRRLTALLEANYMDDSFDVSKICSLLCLCPMQVYRKIKKHTGLSPDKCLLRFRLAKALHLLYATDLTVGEIASQTGFK